MDWKKHLLQIKQSTNVQYTFISVKKKPKSLQKITSQECYSILINETVKPPTAEKKWEEKIGTPIPDWAEIHLLPYRCCRNPTLRLIQYKINHRIYANCNNLKKWKITDNSKCTLCEMNVIEDNKHVFIDCPANKYIFDACTYWLHEITSCRIGLSDYEFLLGIHNPECDTVLENYNLILFWLKIFIHKKRKKDSKNCNMEEFIEFLSQQAKIEVLDAKLTNLNIVTVKKKWSIVLNDEEDVDNKKLLQSWNRIKNKTLQYINHVRMNYNADYIQDVKKLL